MNGYQTGNSPFDYGGSVVSPPTSSHSDNVMTEGFGKDAMNGYDKSHLESMHPHHAPTQSLADLTDPIQVHLLTETALTDSKGYDIITQEEVDRLKKQCQSLNQRVETTRANLSVQSKYRDAAISMAKLHAAGKSDEALRNDHSARDAERERQVAEQKCDELSRELFDLEKRLLKPQRRLLQHTAAILQLTHKASKKKTLPASLNHGIPGSPESLYTYSQSRDSLGPGADEAHLEEHGLYHLDGLESLQLRQAQKSVIDIPLKSPIREQASQLRGELDKAKEENMQLINIIAEMEQKLETVSVSLREIIVGFNPEVNRDYQEPPRDEDGQITKPGELLGGLVDYLESGLVAVQAEQDSLATTGGNSSDVEPVLVGLWDRIQSGFALKQQQKEERRKQRAEKGLPEDADNSDDDEFDPSEGYSLTSFSSKVEWLYSQASTLKDQKSVLKRQIKQQRELNNKTDAEKDEELDRRQEELDNTRQLLDRAEKETLTAQTMLADALEDLERVQEAAGAAGPAQAEIQQHVLRIQSLESEMQNRSANIQQLESEVQSRSTKMEQLESEIQSRREKMEQLESENSRTADIQSQLDNALKEKVAAEEAHTVLKLELERGRIDLLTTEKELAKRDDELEQLNIAMAELKTEVTIAKAELDGAYGTRAERAADAAAFKNNSEVVKLSNHVERLKKELAGTVQDLETITKETIGTERERIELEHKLDEILSAKTILEADLDKARDLITKLQEDLDSERFKVAAPQGGSGRPGPGASMLSEQFRMTMREERKKFQEDIKEERTRSRKLEEELNRLKRSQGPGRSPLSPR